MSAGMLLDDLIERFGEGALLTAGQYVLGEGRDDFRWIVRLDGEDMPDLDVRVSDDPDYPGISVMTLIRGSDNAELELFRGHELGVVVSRILRDLRDSGA